MNKKKFMEYMKEQFTPMDNHFTYEMVENILDYARLHFGTNSTMTKSFLYGIIPEITMEEIEEYLYGSI